MKPQYILKSCICALLLTVNHLATAQKLPYNPEEYIEWSDRNELAWDLFNGKPSENALGDAGTAVKIKAKPYRVNGEIHYNVYALFNKKKSWCKGKSEQLLDHEQLHFDIAEITARQVRKKVEQMQKNNIRDFNAYNKAINRILIRSNDFDAQYDKDTFHGILKTKQKEWEKKVSGLLSELEAYAKKEMRASTL